MTEVVDLDEVYRNSLSRRERRKHHNLVTATYYSSTNWCRQAAIAIALILAHVGFLLLVQRWSATVQYRDERDSPSIVVALIQKPQSIMGPFLETFPEPKLTIPAMQEITLPNSRFGYSDAEADLVDGITAPSSAPQLDPHNSVDLAECGAQAGLAAGEAATVVLAIEVLADGTTGDVSVVTGSANTAINAEAMSCARALRWIPGTVGHKPHVTRIYYPLTLTAGM